VETLGRMLIDARGNTVAESSRDGDIDFRRDNVLTTSAR